MQIRPSISAIADLAAISRKRATGNADPSP